MEKDIQRGSAVVKAPKSNSSFSRGKELGKSVLEAVDESGLFGEMPGVGFLLKAYEVYGLASDLLLYRKVERFTHQLSEIPRDEIDEMLERLNEDDKFAGRLGETLLDYLDRIEIEKKPELAAKFFAAHTQGEITYDQLRHILFALERVPAFDIEKLKKFSMSTIEDSVKMDETVLFAFVNAGLGRNNGGLSGGAIVPTTLCQTFVKAGKL